MKESYKAGKGLLLIGVGTQLTAMIAAGFLLGYGLDQWVDTTPLFLLLFGALGFVGGFLKAYQLMIKFG